MSKSKRKSIERWPLERLQAAPWDDADIGDMPEEKLEECKEGLRREGQPQPIECLINGWVLSGHAWWWAAQQLGWKEVDVWARAHEDVFGLSGFDVLSDPEGQGSPQQGLFGVPRRLE